MKLLKLTLMFHPIQLEFSSLRSLRLVKVSPLKTNHGIPYIPYAMKLPSSRLRTGFAVYGDLSMMELQYQKHLCKRSDDADLPLHFKMATNEQKKRRTVIAPETKMVLNEFYANGMISKGQKCQAVLNEAADKTGLPVNVVKEWVGNKKKKELHNRPTFTPRPMYKKGVSSYNAFVHEKKAELGGIGAGWSSAWNALPPSQKASYKEKALEMTRSQVLTKAQLLNNICNSIKELSKHGISVACVGGNLNDGSQILFGTPPTETFFIQRPNVLQDLLIFCKERSSNSPCPEVTKEQETDTKKLRKNAADHLNTLYRTATGLPKPFPYKKVFSGDVVVNGLPEEVLPLKFPSHYGEKKLKAILSCETIEVLSQQENTGVFEEADTSEELLNLEEYQEVTEEDAQVLLPLFPEIQTNGMLLVGQSVQEEKSQ